MSRTARIGAVVCVASLSLSSCGARADAPATSITSDTARVALSRLVGPDEFAAAIFDSDRVTINVHVPYEGDIAGTDLSIPFDQIADQAERLPRDRNAAIAIYCRSGPMSATAAEALNLLGYTDVIELEGGMNAWRASGRPLMGV